MKDHLAQLLSRSPAVLGDPRNLVREYLQARILQALQRAGAFVPLALCGGTALRFLHGLPRFSEDLDFALERHDVPYDLRASIRRLENSLGAEGYAVESKVSDQGAVHSAFVRFPGLLYELGLSPHGNQKLAIKLEVDTRPPAGARLDTTVVRRHVVLNLQHHDRGSLFAGKLHALLQRSYVKGRDVFDLMWYLADPAWPPPNLEMLNNALNQTGWEGGVLDERGWREAIVDLLEAISFAQVVADVEPFIEPQEDLSALTGENLLKLVR
jgi:hypothetical protein